MHTDEQKYLAAMDLGNALERLKNNPDFQLAIKQGYLQDHALKTLKDSVNSIYTEDVRSEFLKQSHATSRFDMWMGDAIRQGREAPLQIAELREQRFRAEAHRLDENA